MKSKYKISRPPIGPTQKKTLRVSSQPTPNSPNSALQPELLVAPLGRWDWWAGQPGVGARLGMEKPRKAWWFLWEFSLSCQFLFVLSFLWSCWVFVLSFCWVFVGYRVIFIHGWFEWMMSNDFWMLVLKNDVFCRWIEDFGKPFCWGYWTLRIWGGLKIGKLWTQRLSKPNLFDRFESNQSF